MTPEEIQKAIEDIAIKILGEADLSGNAWLALAVATKTINNYNKALLIKAQEIIDTKWKKNNCDFCQENDTLYAQEAFIQGARVDVCCKNCGQFVTIIKPLAAIQTKKETSANETRDSEPPQPL